MTDPRISRDSLEVLRPGTGAIDPSVSRDSLEVLRSGTGVIDPAVSRDSLEIIRPLPRLALTSAAGTVSGALTRRTARALVGAAGAVVAVLQITGAHVAFLLGSIDGTGALARQTGRALAGTPVLAGGITKRAVRDMVGAFGMSGSLVAHVTVLIVQVLAGVVQEIAGELAKQVGKVLTAPVLQTGYFLFGDITFGNIIGLALYGALDPLGSVVKHTSRSLVGAAGAILGVLGVGGFVFLALAGALTSSTGHLAKRTGHRAVGAVGSALGSLRGRAGKALAGVLEPAGAVRSYTSRTVAGALAAAGALTRRTSRSMNGLVEATGALTRQGRRALGGAVGASGALVRRVGKGLGGDAALAGTLAWSWVLVLAGALGLVGTLAKRTVATPLAGAVGASGAVAKYVGKVLVGRILAVGGLLWGGITAFVLQPAHVLFGRGDVDPGEVTWFDDPDPSLPMEFWYLDTAGTRHLGFNLSPLRRITADVRTVWLPPTTLPTLTWAEVATKQRGDPFASDRLLELL